MCNVEWYRVLMGYRTPPEGWEREPATDVQLTALARRGFTPPSNTTKGEAHFVLGRPTPKQRKILERRGLFDPDMTFTDAQDALARVAREEGW
jgi:hypothetical protein